MPPAYKYVQHRGQNVAVTWIEGTTQFSFCLPSGPGDTFANSNAEYQRWLAEGGDGITAPADPPSVAYAGRQDLEFKVQTIGTTPADLARFTLTTQTGYVASIEVVGIDAGNGVMKRLLFAATFKRLNGGALAVATKTDLASHQDSGAAATTAGVANWTITPGLDTNDAVISVAGHTGRTVDWFAFVTLRRFRPGGGA